MACASIANLPLVQPAGRPASQNQWPGDGIPSHHAAEENSQMDDA